jgi:hypothetical protein
MAAERFSAPTNGRENPNAGRAAEWRIPEEMSLLSSSFGFSLHGKMTSNLLLTFS